MSGATGRRRRAGRSPLTIGLIVLAIVVVAVFLGFTKDIPFTHGFRVNAVFESANSIRINSPVRIAGVNVGKVKSVSRKEGTNQALVTMEIKKEGLPIHEDATAKIRPRIFLEGNFFVDLKPGSRRRATCSAPRRPLGPSPPAPGRRPHRAGACRSARRRSPAGAPAGSCGCRSGAP